MPLLGNFQECLRMTSSEVPGRSIRHVLQWQRRAQTQRKYEDGDPMDLDNENAPPLEEILK